MAVTHAECLLKCMSEPLHVCVYYVLRHTSLDQTLPTIWVLVLSCVLAELWSSVTPASAHIAARGLLSKPVSHRGNHPYCSCHGKQAPSPLVLRRYCCRAPGVQKTDDAQMLPTSAGAVKPLQSELELTVQRLQIFGCSLRTVALLALFFSSPPSPLPHSPPPLSSAELSLAPL